MSEDRAGPGPEEERTAVTDDLDDVRTPMTALAAHARSWLALAVVLAMLLPLTLWLFEEVGFRSAGSEVVETLEGELAGADVADAVLLVRAVGCDGSRRSGSAFVLRTSGGPQLVTNRHVVEGAGTVGLRALDGSIPLRVTGARLASGDDVAVLEVDDPRRLPPALTRREEPLEVDDEVRLVGFPAATPFTTAGAVVAADGARLVLDLDVDPGASGSPVVGPDGQVGGQVFAVTESGLGVATPVAAVLEAVRGAQPAPGC